MEKIYWNIKDTLSYNALLNFIVGNRGGGKTFGCKKWCIDDFIKNGNKFIWVRRFNSEYEDFKSSFFTDIKEFYPNNVFEFKTNNNTAHKFYCDGELMGYGIPLSVSQKKKSNSYADVNKIIFDEFIIDRGSSHYLRNEVEVFLDLLETTMRMRTNFRGAFLVANAITFTNPYFLYFDVKKPTNKKKIRVKDDVLIQFVADEEYIQAKKETRLGKLLEGTRYAKYSIENEFLRDNNDFVIKNIPQKMKYMFTLRVEKNNFGVWLALNQGMIVVSSKYEKTSTQIYATTLENHEPNTILLKGGINSSLFDYFKKSFKLGCVYFDSVKTKNVVMESIKYII